jgi:hypothetical protein|tara:strand:- start:6213 stop:6833 length:621 start_codon:yes stop_codon:yes gene_type:complete
MAGIKEGNKPSLVLKEKGKPFDFSGILTPLKQTGGIIFPFTPTIQFSHQTSYGTYDVAGSIYQQNYYMNTPNPNISVTAMFAANTKDEAEYTAAALHFLKTCTKSDFGSQRLETAGTPPPILKFNAYGVAHASSVPVVMRSFNYTLPEDTDYVEVSDGNGGTTSIPALLLLSIELVPQLPPKVVKDSFNIQDFASGSYVKKGGGFI